MCSSICSSSTSYWDYAVIIFVFFSFPKLSFDKGCWWWSCLVWWRQFRMVLGQNANSLQSYLFSICFFALLIYLITLNPHCFFGTVHWKLRSVILVDPSPWQESSWPWNIHEKPLHCVKSFSSWRWLDRNMMGGGFANSLHFFLTRNFVTVRDGSRNVVPISFLHFNL